MGSSGLELSFFFFGGGGVVGTLVLELFWGFRGIMRLWSNFGFGCGRTQASLDTGSEGLGFLVFKI